MGSLGDVNLLAYMRSKTQVDVDAVDVDIAARLGPFADCTSNQMDAYTELLNPRHAPLLKKAAALGKELTTGLLGGHDFKNVTEDELAVEIAMVSLGLLVLPHLEGKIHIMANPVYACSTEKVVENGQRIALLCKRFEPDFDTCRLVIKVASTWEGLQACRKLKVLGVQTLATTVFSMPQAVLAGEVGVKSISPFCHELRAHLEEDHHDPEPIVALCVEAQHYFEQHHIPTRVKACGAMTVDEILQLAGVAAMTIAPGHLDELASTNRPESELEKLSLFSVKEKAVEKVSYVDDEEGFRAAFKAFAGGKGEAKTMDGIECFCEYQKKAEALMRDPDLTKIG